MYFDDKITRNGLSDSENRKRDEKMANQMEPFPFSALHFLRNRLIPTGTWQNKLKVFKSYQKLYF